MFIYRNALGELEKGKESQEYARICFCSGHTMCVREQVSKAEKRERERQCVYLRAKRKRERDTERE